MPTETGETHAHIAPWDLKAGALLNKNITDAWILRY
jgi:hypothetical protein